jgi:[acyl-carrier-protein] S-malonyltransferase
MAWIVNLDTKIVETLCKEASKEGQEVYVSAYDSPTQTSISGHTDVLMKVAGELEKKGAIVYPLKLNGPFHSPLMKDAAEEMRTILGQYAYKAPKYPMIANRNAIPYEGMEHIIDNLSLQLISPIRWRDSIEYLLKQYVEIAIEIGPKNVLKFLMAKNTDSILTYTTDNEKDLELIVNHLTFQQEEYVPLIGRCLGAAVGTKNRNPDAREYEEYVVKPYRKIEAMYRELQSNGMKVGKDEVKDAVEMLHAVMAAKKVPEQEQKYWFDRIFGNKIVSL